MRRKLQSLWLPVLMIPVLTCLLIQCGGSSDDGSGSSVSGPGPCLGRTLLTAGTYSWVVSKVSIDCPGYNSLLSEIINGIKGTILVQEMPDSDLPGYEEIDPTYTINDFSLPLPNEEVVTADGILSESNGRIVLVTDPETIEGNYQGFPYSATVTGDICPSSGSAVTTVFKVALTVEADNGSGLTISVDCTITVTMAGTLLPN